MRRRTALLHLLLGLASFPAAAAEPALARDRLLEFRGADGAIHPVTNAVAWQQRRAAILEAMQSVMGRLPGAAKRVPLETETVEEIDCGAYVRRLVRFTAEPGNRVPAYLLIPKTALSGARPAPAVLTLHQTHPQGQKVVVGLGGSPDDEYGVELARRGYICLAPPYPMLADYWPDVKALGWESGTLMGVWINIRGLDLLESLPFVRPGGFGCIGHSLGGHNGVFTAAFDERLRVVVSSCGLDSFRDYYGGDPKNWQPGRGWCQVRYMPRLAEFGGRPDSLPFDFAEVLAAIAPRRVLLSAPFGDSNFQWRSVDRVSAAANEAFSLPGNGTGITVLHPDGPHRFPPAARLQAYQVLDEVLDPSREAPRTAPGRE